MLTFLPERRIQFAHRRLGWREAIRLAGAPLVADGCATPDYLEAAIAIAEEHGPYFNLGHGFAMPHARPESGARERGLAFLRTRPPVELLDAPEQRIDVFIMLVATDSQSHLEMLRLASQALVDPVRRARLKAATTPAEVSRVLASIQDAPTTTGPDGPGRKETT